MAISVSDSIVKVYRPYWAHTAPPVYRAVIRDFGNGQCEVLTHSVQHAPSAFQLLDSDMAAAGIPISDYHKEKMRARVETRAVAIASGELVQDQEKNVERSVRRAKQAVRWRIKGQLLDHMLTLTIRENLTDRQKLKQAWAKFLRLVKEKSGGAEWPYVAAVETQERGALHLHVAIRGRQDVHKLRGLWWRALGARVSWSKGVPSCLAIETPGNIDVRGPRRGHRWRPRSLAGYLSKYIGKEMDLSGKHERRYWAPTGWQCPKVVRYLIARDLRSALIETADIFEGVTGAWGSPWKSPDWSCLWVST